MVVFFAQVDAKNRAMIETQTEMAGSICVAPLLSASTEDMFTFSEEKVTTPKHDILVPT